MKSISIELLQSQPQAQDLTNLVPNSDFINASQWTNLTNFSLSAGFMNKTVTSVGSFEQTLDTEEDFLYKLRVKFKNFNKSGKVVLKSAGINGVDVVIVDNTFNLDTGTTSAPSTQHIQDIQFVKGSTNTDKIVIEAEASTLIEISFVRMFLVSNADSQVLGVLDADTSKDFPLSLTFSINDVNNIDARNGLFSKTFEVPATANNNKLLKYFNVSSSTMFQAPIHRKIPCRIVVDNLISVAGLFQVKDVKKIRGVAVSYSCNFFGDNLSWATEIENLTLKDLELDNSTDLLISAEKILESWWSDNATSKTNNDNVTSTNTSPIVYPIATYGSTNDNGFRHTMSLLRNASDLFTAGASNFNADTVMIGQSINNVNHDPSMDWRPMIWVYRMIHKIFSNIGYTIESNFIESAEFKKLLFATPNFLFNNANDRYQNFSFLGNFQNNNCALTGNAALDKPKFLFHKEKHLVRGSGIGVVLSSGSSSPSKFFYAPTQQATSKDWSAGKQIKKIRLADPNDCGTYTTYEGGTKRFQPQVGDIVIGNNTLQQSTLIEDLGSGSVNDTKHNTFLIGESGYYRLTAKNFSYEIECNDGNGDGGYSGTGWSTTTGMSMFNQKNEIKLQGSFIFMVIRAGTTGRRGLGINASTNALVGEQDLGTWEAIEQVGSGAGQKQVRGNLDAVEVQAYLQKGDKVVLGFEFSNTFDETSFSNNGSALKVRTNTGSPNQSHTCSFNMLLYGARQDAYTNSASASFGIELLNPERPEYMSTYNLSDVLPDNLKQLDFIKGLAHAFNLQFSTNTETKNVRIEPFTTFYENPSTAVDWTNKVDLSKEIKESFIDSGFKRKIIFKYKEDSNDKRVEDFAEKFFESQKDAYPQILNLDDTFQVGETKFINPFFAGTWSAQNGYIGNNVVGNPNETNSLQNPSVNFYSACLWENLYPNQSQGKGYKFQPRLLYYNKKTISDNTDLPYHRGASLEINTTASLQIASLLHIMAALPTMPSGTGFFDKTVNDLNVPRKAYLAYANSYDRYNFTNQFALTYGNYWAVDYDIATDTITINGNQVGLGLYERYYRQQIENLISHPKKKTVYVHLSSSDIRNLDFRKKIHINGVYYRLVKIIDYKPQLNETTKVELHQTDTKISGAAPIASQFINPNGDFEAPYEEDETNG